MIATVIGKLIIAFLIYFSLFPLLFFCSDYIKREMNKGKKKAQHTIEKNALVPKISLKERYNLLKKYALKECSNKQINIIVYFVFPIFAFGVGLIFGWYQLITLSLLFPFLYLLYLIMYSLPSYKERKKHLLNILIFKKTKMNFTVPQSTLHTYQQEFTVVGWKENIPTEIIFTVPITFAPDNKIGFLGEFSEKFSYKGYWKEKEWNDDENTFTIVWEEFFDNEQLSFLKDFLLFKKKVMGLSYPQINLYTYYYEIDNIIWDKNKKPVSFSISIPVAYDILQQDAFLDALSNNFGGGSLWEIDLEKGGWDSTKRIAYFSLQPPLPELANWNERYLYNDIVQWSFFPIGIGSRGGVPFTEPNGETVRLVGFDVNGSQSKYMSKIGLPVTADLMSTPHILGAGVTGGGKSVAQRNFILGCLLRPKDWFLIILDMKKVEGAMWRKYGVPVATTYEDCACLLSYANAVMMERFTEMELRGINDWGDMPKELQGPAIMINVDEVSQLFAAITGKTDEDKMNAEYQAQCNTVLENIARLGRAARVHILTFGQRPDKEVVTMQIRQNCGGRLAAGNLPSTISGMVFESNFGTTVPSKPRGRIGIRVHSSSPFKAQGFFAPANWLTTYLKKNNLPINIQGSSEMAKIYNQNLEKAKEKELLGQEMSIEEYNLIQAALSDA